MLLASFFAALGLAMVHLLAGKLTLLPGRLHDLWLSIAGGLSVAFVFVYLLPQLATKENEVNHDIASVGGDFLPHPIFVLALLGMIAFLGLERIAKVVLQRPSGSPPSKYRRSAFWAHLASFAFYNLVIGYMLVGEQSHWHDLVLFFIAITLHYTVMDFSFREHYQIIYHRSGRWILAMAVLAGWAVGQWLELPKALVSAAMAFVSGGIILNILKEELPEEKQSRFLPFVAGAFVYSVIAMAYAA